MQKEAFEALQLQKDKKHARITGQIELIQNELAQLSLLEVEQRDLKVEMQVVSTFYFVYGTVVCMYFYSLPY